MDMPVAFRNRADPAAAAMLIEGKIVERAPVGSPHAGMVKILNRLFGRLWGVKIRRSLAPAVDG